MNISTILNNDNFSVDKTILQIHKLNPLPQGLLPASFRRESRRYSSSPVQINISKSGSIYNWIDGSSIPFSCRDPIKDNNGIHKHFIFHSRVLNSLLQSLFIKTIFCNMALVCPITNLLNQKQCWKIVVSQHTHQPLARDSIQQENRIQC